MSGVSDGKDTLTKYYMRLRVVILLFVFIPLIIYQVIKFGRVEEFPILFAIKFILIGLIVLTFFTSRFKEKQNFVMLVLV